MKTHSEYPLTTPLVTSSTHINVRTNNNVKQQTLYALIIFYWAYFYVRSHLPATLPWITKSTGLSKSQIGIIYSVGYASLTLGKLVNGLLLSFIAGKKMLVVGIAGAVVSSVILAGVGSLFSTSTSKTDTMISFIILWSSIRWFQSIAWGAIIKILSQWFGSNDRGKAVSLFAISYGFGDALIRVMLGVLGSAIAWYEVWYFSSAMAVFISFCAYPFIVELSDKDDEVTPNIDTNKGLSSPPKHETLSQQMKQIVIMKRFWLVVVMYMGLTMIRETFLSWTAQFIVEVMDVNDSLASIFSLVIPLFSGISAIIGGHLYDGRKSGKELIPLLFMCSLLVSVGSLSISTEFLSPNTIEAKILGMILLCMIAFSIEAPYILMDGVYTMSMGGKNLSGLTVGILQAAGNVGAISSGSLTGYISEKYGWSVVLAYMCGILVITIALALRDYLQLNAKISPQQHEMTKISVITQ